MEKPRISKKEFKDRIAALQKWMVANDMAVMLVYGDEYRKENLRYVSNYWPMFERSALIVGRTSEPILLCAPEGEQVAHEMSVWPDIRLVPDFLCATVPDAIEYPLATYTDFPTLSAELRQKEGDFKQLGLIGIDAMTQPLYETIKSAFAADLVDCNHVIQKMRRTKSDAEIACLAEANRIADAAFKVFMDSDLIGMTEIEAAGVIEGAARAEGAEHVIFTVLGSGERTHTIIGRPTAKVIEDGDMIMCALAIQYEGYVATCEVPFAVGTMSKETKHVIDVLIGASAAGVPHLKPGVPMKKFVIAVKDHFKKHNLSEYDVYPPLHGIGCAEAESPYPHEKSEEVFTVGTTVNTDISLFGLPGGSNRIEEGFVITADGARSLSPFVRLYCEKWLAQMNKEASAND
ncbi:MAG: Xaa-Pro peptidase family protein [Sphaerochaetaceae bacterium]